MVVLPPCSEVVPLAGACLVAAELLGMVAVSSLEEESLDGGQGTYGDQEGEFGEGAVLEGSRLGLALGPLLQCLLVQLPVS